MTTARDIITLALKEAGVLGVGQTPLAEDMNDSFKLLTNMINQWQRRRWLIPMLTKVSAIGNNQKSNPIGPGQYYNALRPDKIQAAYFVQRNTGQTPVSFPLISLWAYEDYARLALKDLNSWPQFFFYDNSYPYGNVYVWPVASQQYEIHLILKAQIGFTQISTEANNGAITNPGANYTDGNYIAVPLTGGKGNDATADITVAGNVITTIIINNPGYGYKIGDILSANSADIGGTGTGFQWTVYNTATNIDDQFDMPEEYEEAIHYNLAVRLMSMYDKPKKDVTIGLAKVSLNTIKVSNTQIPTIVMPPALQRPRGFNIYNPDGGTFN